MKFTLEDFTLHQSGDYYLYTCNCQPFLLIRKEVKGDNVYNYHTQSFIYDYSAYGIVTLSKKWPENMCQEILTEEISRLNANLEKYVRLFKKVEI